MASGETRIRRTVYYEGRVQGVGFRYTTNNLARDFHVVGQVKNLEDGRVELVVEGPPDEITKFLGKVSENLGRYIRNSQVVESPATGQFATFFIASN